MTTSIDQTGGKADVAKDQASQVADSAKQQASDVAATAKEQAGHVVTDAKTHVQDLLAQTTDQVGTQADEQAQRLAGNLKALSEELASMAEDGEPGSTAHTLVDEAARRAGSAASYLDGRTSGQLLGDVSDFARRRPGAFILGSAVAGLLVGRLGRATKDAPDTASSSPEQSTASTTVGDTTLAPMTAPGRAPVDFEETTIIPSSETYVAR